MDSWHSYPSIFALGHRALEHLLDGPVMVQEKIDGSQFSFGVDSDGVLKMRSKGTELYPEAPEKLFKDAVATTQRLKSVLQPGWTYRGEYLRKPKHNVVAYNRVPKQHIILFDINTGHEAYLPYNWVAAEAHRLGLEVVPLLATKQITDIQEFRSFLNSVSVLEGSRIEGVVIKPVNYDLFGADKKALMGKFVSEAYKEVHAKEWAESNPGNKDIVQRIGLMYQTEARWRKAIQHLREQGNIADSPTDIGLLIKEVPEDVLKEYEADIKDTLFTWAWPSIRRIITAGLPEWYKEELLKRQFAEVEQ